jgi:hypothetical protein
LDLALAPHHLLELDLADGISGASAIARQCHRPRGGSQALCAGSPLLAPPPPACAVSLDAPFVIAQGGHAVHIYWVQLAFHLQT